MPPGDEGVEEVFYCCLSVHMYGIDMLGKALPEKYRSVEDAEVAARKIATREPFPVRVWEVRSTGRLSVRIVLPNFDVPASLEDGEVRFFCPLCRQLCAVAVNPYGRQDLVYQFPQAWYEHARNHRSNL